MGRSCVLGLRAYGAYAALIRLNGILLKKVYMVAIVPPLGLRSPDSPVCERLTPRHGIFLLSQCFWRVLTERNVERSDGTESKPLEGTIMVPVFDARVSTLKVASATAH